MGWETVSCLSLVMMNKGISQRNGAGKAVSRGLTEGRALGTERRKGWGQVRKKLKMTMKKFDKWISQ